MEEKKIGKNVSSGAKKVESVERDNYAADTYEPKAPAKKSNVSKKTSAKKSVKHTPAERAQKKEKKAAERRVEAAKAKAAKKEQKLLNKAQLKQKKIEKQAAIREKKIEKRAALAEKAAERKRMKAERKAALKEKRTEKRAEKIARRELLRNESKAEKQKRILREKQERLALKRQKQQSQEKAREDKIKAREAQRDRRAQERRDKRRQKKENKERSRGIGGWLAAVISLGVACLALATVVTAGGFRMNDMMTEATGSARSTLFEMVSVSEDMDNNLSKLRISSGANEQRKLITDILVDSALMESAIERIPLDAVTGTDISAFVNKTNSYCRTLLSKLAAGGTLTTTEKNTVNYLYDVNTKLYNELNELATHMTEGEFAAFLRGKEGTVSQKMSEIGQGTLAEPEDTVDAPFSGEGNVGDNQLSSEEEVTASHAEELVKEYLKNYHIKTVRYTGETAAKSIACHNFVLTDENDVELYAQISKQGGKLVFFDTYETCTQKNFDLETCDSLAREFLAELGMSNVDAVWLSDAGMVADITYVSNDNGVRAYPDIIRIRVCESKGRVVGMDASGYLLNYQQRKTGNVMSEKEAVAKLSKELRPFEAHLALVPIDGKEVLAYEIACAYGEKDVYIVYLDAVTGEEVQVYRVRESAQGRYLR